MQGKGGEERNWGMWHGGVGPIFGPPDMLAKYIMTITTTRQQRHLN